MKRRHLFWAVVGTQWACGAGLPSPSDQAIVAEYEAAQLACVAEAGTRDDADACRRSVKAQYHRPIDGGAP